MKLGTRRTTRPDGELVVVSRDLKTVASAADIAPTLQAALDDWTQIRPRLEGRYAQLMQGTVPADRFDPSKMHSPLPRAYQWCDGSAYLAHAERMSKWSGRPIPKNFLDEPRMYQGASDVFLAPMDNITAASEEWGIDFEAEVAVITTDVPCGVSVERARDCIALVMLCNDVSLRNLIQPELAKGFGFVQSKPASAFSPVAVTTDELGSSWCDARLHLPVSSYLNEASFGAPDAGEMVQGFDRLIAHVAKTRSLSAGSIIGGGTVAVTDETKGTSCIAEQRIIEALAHGEPKTPWLKFGDRVRIEMFNEQGASIFGAIDQRVAHI